MGCDIHMHIEVKYKGEWHHLGHPSVTRHYAFFAHFGPCGRAEDIEPIAPSRGVPDDMSVVTRIDWERCDGWCHSASWIGKDEITYLDDTPYEDVRLVFWFDN
jgi:hypothetical protein